MRDTDLEKSTFQDKPAYRYIRKSDNVPAKAKRGRDVMAKVKLFNPTGSWTWYITEYDPKTRIAYGLVDGFEKELGYWSMEELVSFRGHFGLPIERDIYWKPCPLSDLVDY